MEQIRIEKCVKFQCQGIRAEQNRTEQIKPNKTEQNRKLKQTEQ